MMQIAAKRSRNNWQKKNNIIIKVSRTYQEEEKQEIRADAA